MNIAVVVLLTEILISEITDLYTDKIHDLFGEFAFVEFVKVIKTKILKLKSHKEMAICDVVTFSGQILEVGIHSNKMEKYCGEFVEGFEGFLIGNPYFIFDRTVIAFEQIVTFEAINSIFLDI